MPFKKKIYHHTDGAGVPVEHLIVDEKVLKHDDGTVLVENVSKCVDVSDPLNYPAFPDVESFNDLESQLRAGVSLTRVNTSVIHNDDVAETNRVIENEIDFNNPLNTSIDEN